VLATKKSQYDRRDYMSMHNIAFNNEQEDWAQDESLGAFAIDLFGSVEAVMEIIPDLKLLLERGNITQDVSD